MRRRCICVLEAGRCACVKKGCVRRRCICDREMRDDLRRDKDAFVGCLLGWAKHFSLHLPFSGFSFSFFLFFLLISCWYFPISQNGKALSCLILWLPRRRLVDSNEWLAMSRLAALKTMLSSYSPSEEMQYLICQLVWPCSWKFYFLSSDSFLSRKG